MVCLAGLRGPRRTARGHWGAGEGAEKLQPNQHGVQLPSPNLQVTPRRGGDGQSPQQLGAPSRGDAASSAIVTATRAPRSQSGAERRGGTAAPPSAPRPRRPQRGPRRAPSPPLPREPWRCAWLRPQRRRRRRERRVGAAQAARRRGSSSGGGRARGSGCGRGARRSPCSPACCCCSRCACSGAPWPRRRSPGTRPPRPGRSARARRLWATERTRRRAAGAERERPGSAGSGGRRSGPASCEGPAVGLPAVSRARLSGPFPGRTCPPSPSL